MFGCANGEWVLGEVVCIGLGKATLKVEDASVTGADECVFVGDGTFKVGDSALQGFDAGLLLCDLLVQCGNSLGMCGLDRLQKGFEHLRHKVGLIRSRREIVLPFAVCREFLAGTIKEPVKTKYLASGLMELDNEIFIILFFAAGNTTR